MVLSGSSSGSICGYERRRFSEIKATCCAFFSSQTPSHPTLSPFICLIFSFLLVLIHFDRYHNSYLTSHKSQPAVVNFFQASVLFSTENARVTFSNVYYVAAQIISKVIWFPVSCTQCAPGWVYIIDGLWIHLILRLPNTQPITQHSMDITFNSHFII